MQTQLSAPDARLVPASRVPDIELLDHAGNRRRLSDLVAGDPTVLQFFRGFWCPKEQAFLSDPDRAVLARSTPAALTSTLLRDSSRFIGSLTAVRDTPWCLDDDPFARVFPALRLRVGRGLLGAMPAPAGPTIERDGSDQPWPWDRFRAA